MDDYIELTSFTHHPYYVKFDVEVPDNWEHQLMYNLPLDEMIETVDYALNNGFTVCWDGDVSEKGFSFKNGVAINPVVKKVEDLSNSDRARFEKMDEKRAPGRSIQIRTAVSGSKSNPRSPSGRL